MDTEPNVGSAIGLMYDPGETRGVFPKAAVNAPQSKRSARFETYGERDSVLECASPLALWQDEHLATKSITT